MTATPNDSSTSDDHHLKTGDYRIAALIFILSLFSSAYFYQGGADNENARFAQVRSIVEEETLTIDKFAYRSADIIKLDDHYFPNKAPGLTLISVPVWWASSQIIPQLVQPHVVALHWICYATSLLTVGILSAAAAAAVFFIGRTLCFSAANAAFLGVAYALSTTALPFSTLYFSHQATAGILILAFLILIRTARNSRVKQRYIFARLLAVGFLLGYAIGTEYPAAIAAGLIGLYATTRFPMKFIGVVALGGIIGLAPLILYNVHAFGSPFYIPYSSYASASSMFEGHQRGYLGVQFPSFAALRETLFYPQRGLFFVAPWLMMVFVAVPLSLRSQQHRAELITCSLIGICFILFNAGYGHNIVYWGGGASTGPRHILPAIPFLVIVIGTLLHKRVLRMILFPLASVSAVIMLLATSVEPRVPYEYSNPVVQLFWKYFLRGQLSVHRHGVFHDALITKDSVAFNLGELFGVPAAFQLTPLIIVWLVLLFALFRLCHASSPQSRLAAMVRAPASWAIVLCAALVIAAPSLLGSASTSNNTAGLFGRCFRGVIWPHPPPSDAPIDESQLISCGERNDQVIKIDFNLEGLPASGVFSIEWRGRVLIPEAGEYRFGIGSDDGSSLYIDGRLLIDNWGVHAFERREGTVFLTKGFHDITLRYYNAMHGGRVSLFWVRPGEALTLVPSSNLFPPSPR